MCCDSGENKDGGQNQEKEKEESHSKVRRTSERASEDRQRVWETTERGELDELTPSLRVSQGASMQGMLPDSPWYWLVLRPGIHLAHAHFTLSAV